MTKLPTTFFKVDKTDIDGLLKISVDIISDTRGWFQEKYQRQKLIEAGFPDDFTPIQQNISLNKDVGVTRGIHAQPWNKYVSVISGKVFAAFVDLRPGTNYGRKVEDYIDKETVFFVPSNVGNSFQTLEPDTIYSYLVDGLWSANEIDKYVSINLSDPYLKINWPISLHYAIISERDLNNGFLKIK